MAPLTRSASEETRLSLAGRGPQLKAFSMTLRPAVFLDRDGTLIEEKNYLSRPEQVRLLPGVAAALGQLRQAGFACVVTTNQSGLGRGLFTETDLLAVNAEMNRQLHEAGAALDGLFWCPVVPRGSDKTIVEHPDRSEEHTSELQSPY